jgi:hypothetical protein
MTDKGSQSWDIYFSQHKEVVQKLEEMLEFGDEKEQDDAIAAYRVMQDHVKQALEGMVKNAGVTKERVEERINEDRKEDSDPILEKRYMEFNQSLKKVKSLIRKKLRKKKQDNSLE